MAQVTQKRRGVRDIFYFLVFRVQFRLFLFVSLKNKSNLSIESGSTRKVSQLQPSRNTRMATRARWCSDALQCVRPALCETDPENGCQQECHTLSFQPSTQKLRSAPYHVASYNTPLASSLSCDYYEFFTLQTTCYGAFIGLNSGFTRCCHYPSAMFCLF